MTPREKMERERETTKSPLVTSKEVFDAAGRSKSTRGEVLKGLGKVMKTNPWRSLSQRTVVVVLPLYTSHRYTSSYTTSPMVHQAEFGQRL